MNEALLISILAASITAGTPILFAALGELISERAGITNLGVDGMMLVGACAGFIAAQQTGSLAGGVAMALVAGALMALIHAYLTITLRANQVVSGLALTLFGTGLSGYLGLDYVGQQASVSFTKLAVPGLSELPVIGPVLFKQDLLVYLSYLLVAATAFYLYRTRPGLFMRALGENPAAVDAVGVNVFGLRYLYVVIGGALAGLGGAYLSLALCSLLAGEYDGRPGLDSCGFGHLCFVGPVACAGRLVPFRRHRRAGLPFTGDWACRYLFLFSICCLIFLLF